MSIFVNRTLNLKQIKAIGFDMDYTLVRYHSEEFEKFTYHAVVKKLTEVKNYPVSLNDLQFDFKKVIQGLVIDKVRGNLLKLSRFGKVKSSSHGTTPIAFHEQQRIYKQRVIDLNDENIQSLDTSFSISNGVLYAQLVDLKEQGAPLPSFEVIADDVKDMLDLAHRDGTLKNEVKSNIEKYIVQDPDVAKLLLRLKKYDKKLLVITNSDYSYTKLLLDYTLNPFLDGVHWKDLFDITITLAYKPKFFTQNTGFLKVEPETGLLSNTNELITNGIFQGGCAGKLQKDLGLEGDEILYLGDHIYGDVVSIKKTFNWRTALVLEPLIEEVSALQKGEKIIAELDQLMDHKIGVEKKLNEQYEVELEGKTSSSKEIKNDLYKELEKNNERVSELIISYQKEFNPNWGELMRAGQEESRFAGQVEKYACIYMSKVSDLNQVSPRAYFRPRKRAMAHEDC